MNHAEPIPDDRLLADEREWHETVELAAMVAIELPSQTLADARAALAVLEADYRRHACETRQYPEACATYTRLAEEVRAVLRAIEAAPRRWVA